MSLTREELREELAAFPTRSELRRDYASRSELQEALEKLATKEDLKRFATKEDLERFATKEDLERLATKVDLERSATKEELKGFATKEDLAGLRNETAQGFADLRRHMEILAEDFKAWTKTLFDGTDARLDAIGSRLTAKDDEQDQRLDVLDRRVTRVESRPRRPSR